MELSSSSRLSEICNFKGKLFRYAQIHGFGLPNYTFSNEGFPHAPCFRATVDVAGRTFTSTETFKHRRDAEHFVSKLAFESLLHQASANILSSSFLKGSKFCKTILYEYSAKKGQMVPSYQTGIPESGPATIFVSKVTFESKTFVGPISKSKNEAEHNAANVVISSLLENTESRILMLEIIQKVFPLTIANHVGPVTKPEEVTEKDLSVPPGFWTVPNSMWKSILKEYGDKKGHRDPPLYKIGFTEGFTSSVSFEGHTYWGPPSKSKKDAEQAAARVAIKSILGDPASRILMLEAMQSRIKLDSSRDVNLISHPSANSNLNPLNSNLDQANANPRASQGADSSCVSSGSLPLVGCSVGPTGSVPGQIGATEVANLSGVGPSKKAQKRARKKERMREAKRVKSDC